MMARSGRLPQTTTARPWFRRRSLATLAGLRRRQAAGAPPPPGGQMADLRTAIAAGVGVAATMLLPVAAHAAPTKQHYAHHPFKVHGNASTSPTGLSPARIKSAYSFPT